MSIDPTQVRAARRRTKANRIRDELAKLKLPGPDATLEQIHAFHELAAETRRKAAAWAPKPPPLDITRAADSETVSGRLYRYSLTRSWADVPLNRVLFVMLNPSPDDDRVLARCVEFASAWGHGSLEVVYLFALVTPCPSALRSSADPVGERNDVAIADAAARASRVVVAWGASFDLARVSCDAMRDQDVHVAALLTEAFPGTLECLGRTAWGAPRHPLMLAKSTRPEPW